MKNERRNIIYCLLGAFVFITICSKCSFLYPINDWGDVNCYFTLGKGMLNGLVPYKDYFEQKGIVIFALYSIGVWLSQTSFWGIYLIEIFLFGMFLFVSIKTMELLVEMGQYKFVSIFTIAAIICSSAFLCPGGSPEELLLVVFAYGQYLGIKYFEKNICPSKKEMFVFGLLAGLLFFSKFTLCMIYISFIVFLIIKSLLMKQTKELFKNSLFFILGCVVTILPVLIYFASNTAIHDFIYVYFYKNIFDYMPSTEFSSMSEKVSHYLFFANYFFRKRNVLVIAFMIAGEAWLALKKKYFLALYQLFTFLSFYYLCFVVMRPRQYYGLPLTIFVVFGMCAIIDYLNKRNCHISKFTEIVVAVFMVFVSIMFIDIRGLMLKSKDTIPQYIFAREMESYGINDYHMLYYGTLDRGYYFASNTLPNCKAFASLNLHGDELKKLQYDHIDGKKCDFIVTENVLCDSIQYDEYISKYGTDENVVQFNDFGYELIDEVEDYYDNTAHKVRLYKIK